MSILCPYCGTKQAFGGTSTQCVNCHKDVPRNYLLNARKRAPIWMVTVGYSQHGKTTFVDSMMMTIEKLGKISAGTVFNYLDEDTSKKIRMIRKEAQLGELPDSTIMPADRATPMLVSLPRFKGNESNTLVIYDLPGEIFDDPNLVEQYADAIRHCETIWFLISLDDIGADKEGRYISDLVRIYVEGLERLGAKVKGRRVLVIYTKADKLLTQLPEKVFNYLMEDPYAKLVEMKMEEAKKVPFQEHEYEVQMHHISEKLKEFTYDNVPGGDALVSLVDYHEMQLDFAVVASVPGANGRTMGAAAPRFRVLDPLIWSLSAVPNGESEGELALILDAGKGYEKVWSSGLPTELYDLLQDRNMAVRTFYTGQSEALATPRPERNPRRSMPRLVGPILDRLPDNSYVLVVVNGPIDDLYDYYYSGWHDRLYILTFTNQNVDWPHRVQVIPGESTADDMTADFIAAAQAKL